MKKVALVTGSSRGIGRAVAAELARDGYAVCINYYERKDKADELVALLGGHGLELGGGNRSPDLLAHGHELAQRASHLRARDGATVLGELEVAVALDVIHGHAALR